MNVCHLSPRGDGMPRITQKAIKAPDPNLYKGLGLEEVAKIEDLVKKFKVPLAVSEHQTPKTVLGRPFIHSQNESLLTRRLKV